MKRNYILLFFISTLFTQVSVPISNESYITGEDGIIRMYVNIMGHVKNPGTYLVYDKVDIMTALSMAGGYLDGSNLSRINIYNINGESKSINLDRFLNTDASLDKLVILKPHDTIYIHEKKIYKFFISSNLPSILLSLMNLAITLDRD